MKVSSFIYKSFFALLAGTILMLASCYERDYYSGNDALLRFSSDTLVFDTVFTTIGSATRILKVYNDREEPVEISSIYVEDLDSKFRINVNGVTGNSVDYVEVGAGDSIYIFGEVTVDPDEPLTSSPFVIEDRIIFELNGNKQDVLLEAWGQNANYIPGKQAKGKAYLTTCDFGEQVWDDDKPYVIYGTLLVDSCTIRIPEGTQIYVHGGYVRTESGSEYNDGQLYFLQHGKLIVEGSSENPVVFQTDRLEHEYDDISGLWSGIFFLNASTGNMISNAVLKNANIGIYLDSATQLDLSYTKVLHNISAGIYARQANLKASNCLIADSGGYGLFLRYGGNYQLDHCTVVNFNNQQEAMYLGNYQCLDPLCSSLDVYPVNASFRNCIFYGNGEDELFFEDAYPDNPGLFQYNMEHCLIKAKDMLSEGDFTDLLDNCTNCLNGAGEEDLFLDMDNYNYRPDTNSIVINKGLIIPELIDDIEGNPRDTQPDIGCYEFK